MEPKIKQKLIDIVGVESFTDQLIDIVAYSKDASLHRRRPEAAVWPATTEQVSKILQLADGCKLPITPRGAGTSLTGSAIAFRGGVVLDLSRMNKILKIKIEDRVVVVQPGVVFDDLNEELSSYGYFFPPSPASGKVATIGGNVATNAGGVKGAKYGTTRDYVLDLEVVLADGSILHTSTPTIKCVSGYDLTRLLVGSEGTLGVVTEISLKVNPLPKAVATCTANFDKLPQAGKAVSAIMHSGIVPSVLELMDRASIEAVNKATALNLPDVEAILLAETEGFTQSEADSQMDAVIDASLKNGAAAVQKAKSVEEAEALWSARKSIYGVLTRLNYNVLAEDLVVPISRLSEMLEAVLAIGSQYGIQIATVAHAGDGNLHPVLVYDGTNPDEVERVQKVEAELFKTAVSLGGTLTGEHGVGISKAAYMGLEHKPIFMKIMNDIKSLFDPNGILNPGKLGLEG